MLSRLQRARFVQHLSVSSTRSAGPSTKHVTTSKAFSSQALHEQEEVVKDFAFEFKASNLRFGRGVTTEIGADLINFNAKKVLLVTDSKMINLPPAQKCLDSMTKNKVNFDVYDEVRCEPTDNSFRHAIEFAQAGNYDAFVAVGGGSAIDTCKVANLFSTHRDYDLYDFVNKPIGKAMPIPGPLKPLIAVPTTTGTGSETTGVAVFDIESMSAKTGIANRLLTPVLALVDSENAHHMPNGVVASSGFDVLCHALESYTAMPFDERTPRPENPKQRPSYQGANPVADIWCRVALTMLQKYFVRAASDMDDLEAREQMQYAACFAGMGFGTAGVHLCHGMSYPISGLTHHRSYVYRDYEHLEHAIIPHGISVVVSAPAVFDFTTSADPARHREAAIMLGCDENSVKLLDTDDIRMKLREMLLEYMHKLKIPMGLKQCGFVADDIPDLVQGTLPQKRVTSLSPHPVDEEVLTNLFENAMEY